MNENFKILEGSYYISSAYLLKQGFNSSTLSKYFSNSNTGKSTKYLFFFDPVNKIKWCSYESIPINHLSKFNLPLSEGEIDVYIEKEKKTLKSRKKDNTYIQVKFILNYAWNNSNVWKKYIPYYKDYLYNIDIRNLYCKTHSLFVEILSMKKNKISMKIMHEVYCSFYSAVFQTENLRSFYNKVKHAKEWGIDDSLIHDFRKLGRGPYKLTPLVQRIIKKHYSSPKRYSLTRITDMVNMELLSIGRSKISIATVKRYTDQPEVFNRCNPFRYGKKYAEQHIYPYLVRKASEKPAEVIQIDSTRLNIPYKNEEGKLAYLYLCAAIDVFSRKIIGLSMDESENTLMILDCLKNSFENIKIIPIQIHIDNHSSYRSKVYNEFKIKAEDFGITHRKSQPKNPKDKGYIERWFRTFQSRYLDNEFGSLGEGITTNNEHGRINKDIELHYLNKNNLRNKLELTLLIKRLILEYNKDSIKGKASPNTLFNEGVLTHEFRKFKKEDIAYLFLESKHIKVNSSMVIFSIEKIDYKYTITNNSLAKKVNGTVVTIMFNRKDLKKIYMFNIMGNEYLGEIELNIPISILPKDNNEFKKIEIHNKLNRKRIEDDINELWSDIEKN